ncbi:ribosome small subunit-dependent GTPase A [Enterococcus nangangensis]|uniref:ribosome small subunit-dependent GTPase A n=1 Tax=Enterococcus nangangensis TaxID=2559926 RepID=UPI0010F5167B|nr:ribosome small subunit-dependent GTPase A [Enterococcus nangangensis]
MNNAFGIYHKENNVARIISENRAEYLLGFPDETISKFNKKKANKLFYVGDFVKYQAEGNEITQLELFSRETIISKSSNVTAKNYHFSDSEQVLATNIQQIFIFVPLDKNFALSKIERYVLVFSQEKVELTIVLSKKDLYRDYHNLVKNIQQLYPQINLLPISVYDESSIEQLKGMLSPGKTGMFIGTSGAGKSTVLNLIQDQYVAKVNDVKKDGKGKHTTTSSFVIFVPEMNYCIVDTPGFKGIDSNHSIDSNVLFDQIGQLALECKFRNCTHTSEPHCAVKAAVKDGILEQEILDRYQYNVNKLELLSKRRPSWRL